MKTLQDLHFKLKKLKNFQELNFENPKKLIFTFGAVGEFYEVTHQGKLFEVSAIEYPITRARKAVSSVVTSDLETVSDFVLGRVGRLADVTLYKNVESYEAEKSQK